MKTLSITVAATTLLLSAAAHGAEPGPPPAAQPATQPSTQPATAPHVADASYGIGYRMGKQLAGTPVKLDVDRVVAGLRDAAGGKASDVPEARVREAMARLQQEMAAGAETKAREEADANTKAGDAFRAENGKKPGVTTTASGLQIETLVPGAGDPPKATDRVKVHYTGTLIDGTKFDSSVDRGEPVTFPLNGVIKGWTEGLQLMKPGGKARLVIPPAIGYGPGGSDPIPPNATLVFEVQLIEVVK